MKSDKFLELINEKYLEIKKVNQKYSVRAFAQKLEMNSGALSAIMSGKRNVSQKLIDSIASKLKLSPEERAYISLKSATPAKKTAKIKYEIVSEEDHKIVSEWQHFAILSLLKTKTFKSQIQWIADRLQTSQTMISSSVKRLLDSKILYYDNNSNLKRDSKSFASTDDIPSSSVRKALDTSLQLAKQSLYRDGTEDRDFTGLIMAIDKSKLHIAKERIRDFQNELSDLLETNDADEVYQLNVQLFPLSKLK